MLTSSTVWWFKYTNIKPINMSWTFPWSAFSEQYIENVGTFNNDTIWNQVFNEDMC